jgi:phage terminase Nu1 subunit (DNA packaging protein)
MNDQAFKLALLGLTDEEIASYFGVDQRTLDNWKQEFPAFFQSLNDGKTKADAEVAHSLYRRAMGEVTYTERRYKNDAGEYEIIRLSQSVPADPGAAKLWLTNRQKRLWRDKIEVAGDPENPIVHKIVRTVIDAGT